MRLLSYNIKDGGRGREAAIAAVLRAVRPDLVLLQEASDPDAVARIAGESGMSHWGARRGHSNGFLSRIPLADHSWFTARGTRHSFLEVVLADGRTRCFGLHLRAWFSKWVERQRVVEIRALLDAIRSHDTGLHVVAGDFNALAPGAALDMSRMPGWIRGMISLSGGDIARTTIQAMADARYVDAWRAVHDGDEGLTFPTWDPQVRLDYVFVPARARDRIAAVEIVRDGAAREASDHFPLLVELARDEPAG
ncbi:MAG: endonuclease/exonuclease/phosphatase family protein [Gemmatimonadaceae bacterium]